MTIELISRSEKVFFNYKKIQNRFLLKVMLYGLISFSCTYCFQGAAKDIENGDCAQHKENQRKCWANFSYYFLTCEEQNEGKIDSEKDNCLGDSVAGMFFVCGNKVPQRCVVR